MNSLLYLSSAELSFLAGETELKKDLTGDLRKYLEKGSSAVTSVHSLEIIIQEFSSKKQFAEFRNFYSSLELLVSEILRPSSEDFLRAMDVCEIHGLDLHEALDAVLALQKRMKIRKDHPASKLPGMDVW
ncbi:MAG: hypothetical protein OEZ34_06170 [Spirochaetia bacterium]|nr:hypothetical protein [Spirochaetia bacterium]